ncbi:hypothetical protein CFB89_24070 [Burkholderia sp. AU16741]|nr:hypothetical protein CFB89_24070 [Burkholderia sp. AU16741]
MSLNDILYVSAAISVPIIPSIWITRPPKGGDGNASGAHRGAACRRRREGERPKSGAGYATIPTRFRYSSGLREPGETLIRIASYQRIYEWRASMIRRPRYSRWISTHLSR